MTDFHIIDERHDRRERQRAERDKVARYTDNAFAADTVDWPAVVYATHQAVELGARLAVGARARLGTR